MNIFLPYENDIQKSVRALDDKRLIKQILEIKMILDNAIGKKNGYQNHPVSKFYENNPAFLSGYGYACCKEYSYRFGKTHTYEKGLEKVFISFNTFLDKVEWVPYYAAGAKNSPDAIRTTEGVSELFQKKLQEKWAADSIKGRAPKWTNREPASFYNKIEQEEKEWKVTNNPLPW